MEETAVQVPAALVTFIPAISVLLQVLKAIPQLNKIKSYFPLIALALGVVCGFIGLPDASVTEKIIGGLILGAASSGMYSSVKALGSSK